MSEGKWVICVKKHFDAGHRLMDYQGKCSNLHGHRWYVEAGVEVDELDELGMGIDFTDLKSGLKDILDEFDHACILAKGDGLLEKLQGMRVVVLSLNPTAEVLAKEIYERLREKLRVGRLKYVKVYESEDAWVIYSEKEEGGREHEGVFC